MVVLCGFGLSALLVCRQNSAEHIKGRVPRRGIYFTTILAKGVFVGFIIFFLSIAIRNVTISYHTMQTSQFFADKVSGYVTVPVNTSNASMQNLNENYKAFYSATVNRYSCRGRLAICEYDNASIIKLFTSAGSIYRRTGNHFDR